MRIYILNQKKMKRKKMKINLKKKKRKSRKSRKEKRPNLGPLLCCSKIHYQTKKIPFRRKQTNVGNKKMDHYLNELRFKNV
jgi:hypothetical protein